ncbi:MAG: type IV toxin-antitoxin system AbiEi family antitoxin, partial [Propionicimonas sp.]
LLVSAHFDDDAAHHLADAHVSFLDDHGNAHVSLDGRTVLFTRASEAGRPSATVTTSQQPQNRGAGALALNRASHRVVFALLADPELAASPVRVLAAAAKASVGTVHNTLTQLTDAGHLMDGRLHHTGRLLDAWAEAYRRLTVRPLTPRALYASEGRWPDMLRLEPTSGVLLGGIAAAAVLDNQLRTTDGIVYAPDLGSAVTMLRLTSTPSPFRVDVRERFWGDDLPSPEPGLVPSVLIYGDLLRDGDARSLDIATHLRRNDAHLRTLE